jgi:hypothetical protein
VNWAARFCRHISALDREVTIDNTPMSLIQPMLQSIPEIQEAECSTSTEAGGIVVAKSSGSDGKVWDCHPHKLCCKFIDDLIKKGKVKAGQIQA